MPPSDLMPAPGKWLNNRRKLFLSVLTPVLLWIWLEYLRKKNPQTLHRPTEETGASETGADSGDIEEAFFDALPILTANANASGSTVSDPWKTTRTIGTAFTTIFMNATDIVDAETGEKLKEGVCCFNPAVLRLPYGAKWEFAVVARGPQRLMKGRVSGVDAKAESLIAYASCFLSLGHYLRVLCRFGANFSVATSKLLPVSIPLLLPLRRVEASEGQCSGWGWVTGPEDPRLIWSDALTPSLQYGHLSPYRSMCRHLALIPDVRDIWIELREVLDGLEGVRAWQQKVELWDLDLIIGTGQGEM